METVLITGANRGIGLALTVQFLASGRRVFATCRNPSEAHELNVISDADDNVTVAELNVAEEQSVETLRSQLHAMPIDILVNNAGIMGGDRQSVEDMDYQAWSSAFEINTMAPFRLSVALKQNLRLSKNPRIVTLSSQMASLNRKSTGAFAYRSTKAALNKVMQVLAIEFEPEGIVVCPVHPGWVRPSTSRRSLASLSSWMILLGLVDTTLGLPRRVRACSSGKFRRAKRAS